MRPLLALETATATARVAVVDPAGGVLAAVEKTAARHSSNLLDLVDEALRTAGLRLADLEAIACGAGPGSFTGLRVGLAVAKGLALPTGLPLVMVSSLEALAADLGPEATATASLVIPCLDAGKDQVYARLFRDGVPVSDEWVLTPDDLATRVQGPAVVGGSGVDRYEALFRARFADGARSGVPGPSAVAVAALARARLLRGETDDLAAAVPSYGRPPDITRPRGA